MWVRPTALAVLPVLFAAVVTACSGADGGDGGDQSVADTDVCFGFTPQGSFLDDGDAIGGALDAWSDVDEDDDADAVELEGDADVCVAYSGPDTFDDATVTLLSDDVIGGDLGVATVRFDDDGDARLVANGEIGDGTPVLGVADGTWLLADGVEQADLHVGSSTDVGSSSPVEGTMIDRNDPSGPSRDHERVLVIRAGDRTYLAAASADAGEGFPVVWPIADDGAVELDEVLGARGGIPLLASSALVGRQPATPLAASLELIGLDGVSGVGTVLASASVDPLAGRGGTDVPMVLVATDSGVQAHPFDPVTSGAWAAGLWLDLPDEGVAGTGTYLAVAHPPRGAPDAEIGLTIGAAAEQETLPGPMATLTVGVDDSEDVAAAIIATADGQVIPTLAANDRL